LKFKKGRRKMIYAILAVSVFVMLPMVVAADVVSRKAVKAWRDYEAAGNP
jgi:hypothetical protein